MDRAAVEVRVYESDQALGLTVRPGHRLVALGYTAEPFLRIDAQGVWVNAASPTAAAVGLLRHGVVGSGWRPEWHGRTAIWHDARVRTLAPGLARRAWRVPLVVDGRRVRLTGEIRRVQRPSPWPWFSLAAPFVALTTWLIVRGPSSRGRAAALLGTVAVTGTFATVGVFALQSSASPGTWVEGANELVLGLVGLAVVARGSADAQSIASGALGLLGLAVGLSKLPVFLHGVVLSVLPATAARLIVAFTILVGASATALGLTVFFDLLEAHDATSRFG